MFTLQCIVRQLFIKLLLVVLIPGNDVVDGIISLFQGSYIGVVTVVLEVEEAVADVVMIEVVAEEVVVVSGAPVVTTDSVVSGT